MSWNLANKLFRDSLKLIDQPERDPQMWNLHSGLLNLSEAIQKDLEDLRQKIERLGQDLQSLR